jgi:hypothetical protein
MVIQLKILKFPIVVWWIFFIVMLQLMIGSMVWTIVAKKWVELDLTQASAGSSSIFAFEGSLLSIENTTEYLISFPGHPEFSSLLTNYKGSPYNYVYCSWCSRQQVLDYNNITGAQADFVAAWCRMYKSLWIGGAFFIAFEFLAMLAACGSIYLLVLYIFKKYYLNFTLCLGTSICVSHYAGIFVWLGTVNFTYGNNCSSLNNGKSPPTVCLKDGPRLGLFVLLLIPIIIVPLFLIILYLKKHHLVSETPFLAEANPKTDIELGQPPSIITDSEKALSEDRNLRSNIIKEANNITQL